MVGATEELARVATGLARHLHTFVRAAVVEHADAVIGMAHHDDRFSTDRRGVEVAFIGHLAGMANVDPGIDEQLLHLQFKQLLVDVQILVDLGLAYQFADGLGIITILFHHVLRRPWAYRSSTRRGVLAREIQIWMTLLLAFSESLRK